MPSGVAWRGKQQRKGGEGPAGSSNSGKFMNDYAVRDWANVRGKSPKFLRCFYRA